MMPINDYLAAVVTDPGLLGPGYIKGAVVYVFKNGNGWCVYSGNGFTLRHVSEAQAKTCLQTVRAADGNVVRPNKDVFARLDRLVEINRALDAI